MNLCHHSDLIIETRKLLLFPHTPDTSTYTAWLDWDQRVSEAN